ncbi:MAG: glycosyltransferase [Planctomycetes bacterium]|nr:glycosyltransferase [Planctomycetota bacterium]
MTKRRFVHVFATFGAGGPQIRAVELLRRMRVERHVVMAMDGRTEAAARLPAGLSVEIVPPLPRGGFLANVRAAKQWLASQRPDLVLTYNWGAIESTVAARRLGLPLVHHEDGFGPEEVQRRLRRRSWLRRFVLRGVPLIVPSAVLQRIATTEWGLASANVHHLPNGVDLARFRPEAPPLLGTLLGSVGGLRAEKDHANLLRAVARLEPSVRVALVGGGPLADELRRLAAELGLGERVEFAGPVADPASLYARFTTFVLSSRTEQMPIAMLEAMACGLPVVATDVGDVRAILPIEANECIVPPADPAALASALQRVLADASLRRRLGAANRARVEQQYEAAACFERFLRVYESSAAARTRA